MEKLVQVKMTMELEGGVSVDLRPVTIADHTWAQREFKKTILEVINDAKLGDSDGICKLLFNQIPYDQRDVFKLEEHKSVDEDGNEKIFKIGGWKKMALMFGRGGYEIALNSYTEALKAGFPTDKRTDKEKESGKK